jgi:hypothetical protein
MATPDIQATQEELFAELDVLASNLSTSRLQFGYTAMKLWNVVMEEFMEQTGGKEKKALGAFIDLVQEREAKDIDSRSTITDSIRVAKAIPETLYNKIVEKSVDDNGNHIKPTFHQIRTVVFQKGNEVDTEKTGAMIDWCVAHKWPPVADIRIYRDVLDPKVKVDPADKHYRAFVKLSQTIMVESPEGSERYNAAKTVLEVWKKENNI